MSHAESRWELHGRHVPVGGRARLEHLREHDTVTGDTSGVAASRPPATSFSSLRDEGLRYRGVEGHAERRLFDYGTGGHDTRTRLHRLSEQTRQHGPIGTVMKLYNLKVTADHSVI
jgi:hypothetical protein